MKKTLLCAFLTIGLALFTMGPVELNHIPWAKLKVRTGASAPKKPTIISEYDQNGNMLIPVKLMTDRDGPIWPMLHDNDDPPKLEVYAVNVDGKITDGRHEVWITARVITDRLVYNRYPVRIIKSGHIHIWGSTSGTFNDRLGNLVYLTNNQGLLSFSARSRTGDHGRVELDVGGIKYFIQLGWT